jgi:hypothetical protein
MIYEFQDLEGNVVELHFSMKEVPSIGCIITRDGKELTRIASTTVQVDPATNRSQYPYVSQCLPRNLAGCKTFRNGKPIVESKRHEREIMARHGYVKD